MNQNKVIGAAVLFLLLGTTIPAFAQTGQEQKGKTTEKAQPAKQQPQQAKPQAKQQPQQAKPQAKQQPQQAKPQAKQQPQQAKPQAKQQPQQAKQEKAPQQQAKPQAKQQPQQAKPQPQAVASNRGNNGNHYGRIPDDRYRANFGHDHSFHMMRPQLIGGYNRFQYGGFSFGFNEGWPSGWGYNDDFYVEYVNGFYYMYNLRHPGIHITLTIF